MNCPPNRYPAPTLSVARRSRPPDRRLSTYSISTADVPVLFPTLFPPRPTNTRAKPILDPWHRSVQRTGRLQPEQGLSLKRCPYSPRTATRLLSRMLPAAAIGSFLGACVQLTVDGLHAALEIVSRSSYVPGSLIWRQLANISGDGRPNAAGHLRRECRYG